MYQLFESIRVEDGKLHNLEYHQWRINTAFRDLFPGNDPNDLNGILSNITLPEGLHKCRISYDRNRYVIRFDPYQRKYPSRLKIVLNDEIEYGHKFEDREELSKLYDQREKCDDILIVKNGLVTDTSTGNILLFKDGQWFTPANPLLQGTQRAFLLDNGIIKEGEILSDHISEYERFMVVNAMMPFDEDKAFPATGIS